MILIILIISFILEGIVSNLVPLNSLFIPLLSVVAIFSVYPLFDSDKKKYLITSFIYGLLYDIVYTNCLFVNSFVFFLTALVITMIYNYVTVNKFNYIFINTLILLFYKTVSYIVLCLFKYLEFNEYTFIKGLYSCLIINIIYGLILYFVIVFIAKKYRLKIMR